MRRIAIVVTGLCCALNGCGSDDKSSGDGSGGTAGSGETAGSGGTAGSTSGGSAGTSVDGSASGGSGNSDGSVSDGSDAGGSGGSEASGGSGTAGSAGEAGAAGLGGMAGDGGTGGSDCSIGEAQNPATPDTLDLFGGIEYYADGVELPSGRYRVTLVDGCMKYSSVQDWTIHAYQAPGLGWYLGTTSGDELVHLPGTIGYEASNGAYADFDACVAANRALPPVQFDFAGGRLGIWLKDDNYHDNVAGEAGRNPLWELVRLGGCE